MDHKEEDPHEEQRQSIVERLEARLQAEWREATHKARMARPEALAMETAKQNVLLSEQNELLTELLRRPYTLDISNAAELKTALWTADILIVPVEVETYITWLEETLPSIVGDLVGPGSGWEAHTGSAVYPSRPRFVGIGIEAIQKVETSPRVWVIEVDVRGTAVRLRPKTTGSRRGPYEEYLKDLELEEKLQVLEGVLAYKALPASATETEARLVCQSSAVAEHYYALIAAHMARWPRTRRLSGEGVYIDTSFRGSTKQVSQSIEKSPSILELPSWEAELSRLGLLMKDRKRVGTRLLFTHLEEDLLLDLWERAKKERFNLPTFLDKVQKHTGEEVFEQHIRDWRRHRRQRAP
jgi:hypothetical protein